MYICMYVFDGMHVVFYTIMHVCELNESNSFHISSQNTLFLHLPMCTDV